MRRTRRQRLTETLVLAVVAGAGIWGYARLVRPDRGLLERFAIAKLHAIFGPNVDYDGVRIDLLDGVHIVGLRVRNTETTEPTLTAESVRVEHDVLAMASGSYRPLSIEIVGAMISTHETPSGLAPDFPFTLGESDTDGRLPEIRLRGSRLHYRAMPDSTRLRPRRVLKLRDVELDLVPDAQGLVHIRGGFDTEELDSEDAQQPRIQVDGTADVVRDTLRVQATWNPLILTDELLFALAEPLAQRLESQELERGRLLVVLQRDPQVAEGEIRVWAKWHGKAQVDIAAFPGAERIDARTREQIQALLGRGDFTLQFGEESIAIDALLTEAAGESIAASGRIEAGGEVIDLTIRVERLRLEDPALRRALGAEGAALFDALEPSGEVTAVVRIRKSPGQPPWWEVYAELEDATLRYVGTPSPEGLPEGFPYEIHQATGQIHVRPGRIEFSRVSGTNGPVDVRLRGHGDEAWTGGPTGLIQLTEEGPEVRMTVEAQNVAVDSELRRAVEGSEFAGLFDRFLLEGTIERILIDIIAEPPWDEEAYAEVLLELDGDRFHYVPFPVVLEEVEGWVVMRRPRLEDGSRGRVFAFRARGRVAGVEGRIGATLVDHEDRGRLHVETGDVPLEGQVGRAILESELTREGLGPVWRFLGPRGRASVTADLPLGEDPDPLRMTIDLQGASLRLGGEEARFPLAIEDLTGRIAAEGDRIRMEGIRGTIHGAAVSLAGTMEGGPEGRWDLRLATESLRLTPDLLAAIGGLAEEGPLLPGGLRLEPGGRLTLALRLVREAGPEATVRAHVVASDLEADVRLPDGSLVLVTGDRLEVRDDVVVLAGVRASGGGIEAEAAWARADEEGLAGQFVLRLDEHAAEANLLALLPEEMQEVLARWTAGRLLSSQGLRIEVDPGRRVVLDGDLSLVASPEGRPDDAPLGAFEVRPLTLQRSGPDAPWALSGRVLFRGFTLGADLPVADLEGEVLVESLRLEPEPEGRGLVRARRARLADLGVRDLEVPVVWEAGILRADPIRGRVAEGLLEGRLVLHSRDPVAYEGEAVIRGFRLAALRNDLAPTGPPYSGLGTARIRFQNRGGTRRDLTASGHVTIREGNLGDLPVLANIFALLSRVLGVEDPPRYERLDAEFSLRDEVLHFERLVLAGPLFEMPGRGTVDLGGLVDLTFTPDFIKSLVLPGLLQVPGVGDLAEVVLREDLLYAIRVRGDLATASPEIVPLPPLGLPSDPPFEGTGLPAPLPRRIPRRFR